MRLQAEPATDNIRASILKKTSSEATHLIVHPATGSTAGRSQKHHSVFNAFCDSLDTAECENEQTGEHADP